MDKRASYTLVQRMLIGAALGGGIVSGYVFLSAPSRFWASGLAILGIGGAVGGAFLSAIVRSSSARVGIAIGGVIGGIGGCIFTAFLTMTYAGTPWPSPIPYPGVQTQIETGGGSAGIGRTQTYTVNLPLSDTVAYYEGQMRQYCVNDWEFKTKADSIYDECRVAQCDIRRWWMGQYFWVYLCAIDSNKTTVRQTVFWED
jgi:hypothetical protein